ncbi:MAG: LamG-like jellyroll fold domain-containing protein [Acidobacteriota bacterium]
MKISLSSRLARLVRVSFVLTTAAIFLFAWQNVAELRSVDNFNSMLPSTAPTPSKTAKAGKQKPSKHTDLAPQAVGLGDLVYGLGYGSFGQIIRRDSSATPNETILTESSTDKSPDWSPDGSQIVFTSGRDRPDNLTYVQEIYLMNADGTNQRRLTFTGDTIQNQSPKFSPDGTKIVYASRDQTGGSPNGRIKILNIADLSVTTTAIEYIYFYYESSVDWSPDGTSLIFSDGSEIYTSDTSGANQTLVLGSANAVESPSFSPNGQKIVYSTNNNIYTANANGTNVTAVSSTNDGNDEQPAWSPDGTKIVFVSYRDNDFKLFVVNADGTNETEVVSSTDLYFTSPSWQPTCTVNPTIDLPNLIARWRGDGNANDSVGSNNGTAQFDTQYSPGMYGQAFDFDGTDDIVEVPDNNDALDVQTGDFTLAAWVNLRSANPNMHYVAGKGAKGDYTSAYFIAVDQDNKPFAEFWNADGSSGSDVRSPDPITLNEWHHLVMRKEGAQYKFFVDNVLKDTQITSYTFGGNTSPFTIGRGDSAVSPLYSTNGLVDEVYLFNRAITDAEISMIYNNANSAGLVSSWRGENNADDSTGANNGDPINDPTYTAGRVGQAFNFAANNSYIRVPDNDSLDVQTGDYSLTAWVNLHSSSIHFIAGKSECGGAPSRWRLSVDDQNRISADVANIDNSQYLNFGTDQPISLNAWHHLVLRKQGTQHQIYVDGVLQTTVDFPYAMGSNDVPFFIGNRDVVCGGDLTNAAIDEVNLYNRAISQEEITDLSHIDDLVCQTPAPQIRMNIHYPNPISAGRTTEVTLYIPENAPIGGATVNLSTVGEAGAISIPPTVTVPEGSNEVNFTINTAITALHKSVDIIASYQSLTGQATASIYPSVADLTVSNLVAPSSTGIGQNISISWTVQNVGQAVADSSYWYDTIYISPDNVYTDDNNTVIGYGYHYAPLAVNATENVAVNNIQIPAAAIPTDGDYYIFVFTNSNSGVNEREQFYVNNFVGRPIHVQRTTAAGVRIAGRIQNASEQPIRNVSVSVTDTNGKTQLAMTNAFGYFEIDNLEAGKTYVVALKHKSYVFASRIITAANDLTELSFTPDP